MALVLDTPPIETRETFERASAALGNHPDQDPHDRSYRHLPPLRMSVITRQAAAERDIDAVRRVGWQYLVKDSLGLAVVDISDGFTETYTSVRRGKFADAYDAALHLIDAECGEVEDNLSPEILEIPQLGSCAILVRGSQQVSVYPLVLSGKLAPTTACTPDDFFDVIIPPALTKRRSNDDNAPTI